MTVTLAAIWIGVWVILGFWFYAIVASGSLPDRPPREPDETLGGMDEWLS